MQYKLILSLGKDTHFGAPPLKTSMDSTTQANQVEEIVQKEKEEPAQGKHEP